MARLSFRPAASRRKPAHFAANSGIKSADGVLKGLGGFIELLSDMEKKGEEKAERTGEIILPGGKAMYGFSVKIGGAGVPVFEHIGNIVRETGKGQVIAEEREPVVEMHEEEDTLEVIIELPGIDEKDISYEIKDDVLTLTAGSKDRKYFKDVKLPSTVSLLKTAYQNGIFKISLKKE